MRLRQVFNQIFFAKRDFVLLGLFCLSIALQGCTVKLGSDLGEAPASDTSASTATSSSSSTSAPTSWAMSSPASGTTSLDTTPQITATAQSTDSISLFTDSGCVTAYGTATAITNGNAFLISGTITTAGLKSFYYKLASVGTCTTTGLSYTYQTTAAVQFSRTFYTAKETGTYIGSSVRVSRDVSGATGSVTLTYATVTAQSGIHFTAGSTTVNFGVDDLYQDIAIGTFTIVNRTGTTDYDRYFTVKVSSPDANSTIGANQLAQVNIIDTDYAGQFFFPHSFFSVSDSAGSITLTVQRLTTGTAETVGVSFLDGSARTATDFDGTALTASFGLNDDETTVVVPFISSFVAVTIDQPLHKAFYARLGVNQTNTVRQQGIAKVRMVDATAIHTCDSAGAPFGGGAGTTFDPYLICSLAQFEQISTASTSSFKLLTDIVADGTLTPIANFSGTLYGYESVIYNFIYAGSGVADTNAGLFRVYKSANGSDSISGLNLLYYKVTNTGTSSGALIGKIADQNIGTVVAPSLTNIHTSGFMSGASSRTGGMLGYADMTVGTVTYDLNNLLSAGVLVAASVGSGGIIGGINHSVAATLSPAGYLMNTSAIVSTAFSSAGGIIGKITGMSTTATVSLSQLFNYGPVVGSDSVGGFVGDASLSFALDLVGTNAGKIAGSGSYVGGVVGHIMSNSTAGASIRPQQSKNYGVISAATGKAGGIVGYIETSQNGITLTLDGSTNYGAVSSANAAGGIAGQIDVYYSGTSVSLSSTTNNGAITGGNIGGILGYLSHTSTSAGSGITISNNFNGANIGAAGSSGVGGIIGQADLQAIGGTNQLTIDANTSTGNITSDSCAGGIACSVGITGAVAFSYGNVQISNSTVSGTLTGAATGTYFGGIAGALGAVDGVSNQLGLSGNSSSMSLTSVGSYSGGQIGFAQLSGASNTINIDSSEATIAATVTAPSAALLGPYGGFIGSISSDQTGTFTISTSAAKGAVDASLAADAASGTGGFIGQVTLQNGGTVNINRSYATGSVTARQYLGAFVGGINSNSGAGSAATLNRVYSTGNVMNSHGAGSVGGIVGNTSMTTGTLTVSNAYSTGNLYTATGEIGGIIGNATGAAAGTVNITNSYSRSTFVPVTAMAGPYGNTVGVYAVTSTITLNVTDSFWRKDGTYNVNYTSNTNVLTDAQMKVQGNFTNWDFATIWQMVTYPELGL